MRLWTALFAFLHHLAAFAIMGTLVAEHVLATPTLTARDVRRLQRIDLAYGIAALALIAIGFARVFYFEKGASYYFHDGWFIVKLSLFLVVGLVSIYPTVVFLSWRRAMRGDAPLALDAIQVRRVQLCLRVELAGITGILLAAALMARGYGYFG
jgi:putative membrane protein